MRLTGFVKSQMLLKALAFEKDEKRKSYIANKTKQTFEFEMPLIDMKVFKELTNITVFVFCMNENEYD